MDLKNYKIKKNLIQINCKNLYLLNSKGNVAYKYSLRAYYFFTLLNYFKENGYNTQLVLKILNRESKNLWFLFLHDYKLITYINLIKNLTKVYDSLLEVENDDIFTKINLINPSSFLIHYNTQNSNFDWFNSYKIFKNYFYLKNDVTNLDIKSKLKQQGFWKLIFDKSHDYQTKSNYIIHFIRVQRRYNKRRYSRVRAYSRAPFFAGITLSSVLVISFWDSSVKLTDWFSSLLMVVDINFFFFFMSIYFTFRLLKTFKLSVLVRKKGRGRILRYLNTILIRDRLLKFFK